MHKQSVQHTMDATVQSGCSDVASRIGLHFKLELPRFVGVVTCCSKWLQLQYITILEQFPIHTSVLSRFLGTAEMPKARYYFFFQTLLRSRSIDLWEPSLSRQCTSGTTFVYPLLSQLASSIFCFFCTQFALGFVKVLHQESDHLSLSGESLERCQVNCHLSFLGIRSRCCLPAHFSTAKRISLSAPWGEGS